MSGRCKSCDTVLTKDDMVRKFPADTDGVREFSDLCFYCHEEAVAVLFGNYQEPDEYVDYGTLCSTHSLSDLSKDW